jgi:hypothetical protein
MHFKLSEINFLGLTGATELREFIIDCIGKLRLSSSTIEWNVYLTTGPDLPSLSQLNISEQISPPVLYAYLIFSLNPTIQYPFK